jgi:glycerol uptake facilitator-like aquaporin
MSRPVMTRAEIAANAGREFVLTTALIFTVVTIVRWLAGPGSPLAIGTPGVLFAVAGALVAILIAGLMASPPGRRSGGHMHAGVSLFVWLSGGLPGAAVLPYIVAQLAGSIAGASLARLLWGSAVARIGYAAVQPAPSLGAVGLVLAEAIPLVLIFTVVTPFLSTPERRRRIPVVIGVGVGLTIAVLAGTSGASLSPARQLGPALLSGQTSYLWIYLLVPVVVPALVAVTAKAVRPKRSIR